MEHYAISTEVCIMLLEDNGGEEYTVDSVFLPENASSESSVTCVALLKDTKLKGILRVRAVLGNDSFDEAVAAIIFNAIGADGDGCIDDQSRSSDDDDDESQSPPASKRQRGFSVSALPGNTTTETYLNLL